MNTEIVTIITDRGGKINGIDECVQHPATPNHNATDWSGSAMAVHDSTLAVKFWKNVEKTAGCWLWTAARTSRGYGHLVDSRKDYPAHRLSWIIAFGPIPDGLYVCHRCDVRLCVRPDHLFLGTHDDNMADMVQKRRSPLGERNARTRLSEEQIIAIHAAVKAGERTSDIAKRFDLNNGHVLQVARGTRWRHLGLEPIFVGPRTGSQYKTHCSRGHELAGDNLQRSATGHRRCRTCRREDKQYQSSRRREAATGDRKAS